MVRAASQGDESARSVFVRSYEAPIRAYLSYRWRGQKSVEAVDDAVQDVFLECIKPGGVLHRADPSGGEFRGLLYAVARNVARRYEERAGRGGGAGGDTIGMDRVEADEATMSRVFDRSWAQSIVREATLLHARAARRGDDGMRFRYRVLQLRHWDGLPVREIAKHLEIDDVDVVHNAYRRARREFRGYFREAVQRFTGAGAESVDAECHRVGQMLSS